MLERKLRGPFFSNDRVDARSAHAAASPTAMAFAKHQSTIQHQIVTHNSDADCRVNFANA